MLYWLFRYLNENTDLPGMRVGEYISFRSAAAIILSLLIAIFAGKHIIRMLRRKQIGEDIRDLGLEGQLQKKGTPTMGGIIIILSLIIPVLLFGNLSNVYVQLMIISTLWLGFLGGLDDYIKVFRHNKEGLKGKFKIVGQVGLGIIVGTTMWLSDDIVIREKSFETYTYTITDDRTGEVVDSYTDRRVISTTPEKSLKTSIPFLKDTMLDYKVFTANNETLAWLLYIVVAIFVITAVSNGANLTDGIDGLLTGVSVPIVLVLGILAYLSGHIIYSDYLNIMYIPDSGELIVFAAAANLVVPILIVVGKAMAGNPSFEALGGIPSMIAGIAICASVAMCLPVSTPPNALAASTGMITTKQMATMGIILGVVGIVLGYLMLIFIGF